MTKLIIKGEMPTLNEHDNANRINRFVGAKMKKDWTDRVAIECKVQKLDSILDPVYVGFRWYLKDKRKDPDNIVFARKYILDGLVQAGIIYNDTQEYILGFSDLWEIDKLNPRVEITIGLKGGELHE